MKTKTIKDWQQEVNRTAKDIGWWDEELEELSPLRMLSICALIHSEVSEAVECIREQEMALRRDLDTRKPIGLPSELADIVIRVFDFAEQMGIDMEEAIKEKNEYNKHRLYRHGGKTV